MNWIEALKIYNRNPALWSVPRKGGHPYEEVLTIMGKHEKVKQIKEDRYKKMIADITREVYLK